jgi:hypothetical protein
LQCGATGHGRNDERNEQCVLHDTISSTL